MNTPELEPGMIVSKRGYTQPHIVVYVNRDKDYVGLLPMGPKDDPVAVCKQFAIAHDSRHADAYKFSDGRIVEIVYADCSAVTDDAGLG